MQEFLTIGICLLCDLSEAGDTYSKVLEIIGHITNVDAHTWDIATGMIKQNLEKVDMAEITSEMTDLIPNFHFLHEIPCLWIPNPFPWCCSDCFEVVHAKLDADRTID